MISYTHTLPWKHHHNENRKHLCHPHKLSWYPLEFLFSTLLHPSSHQSAFSINYFASSRILYKCTNYGVASFTQHKIRFIYVAYINESHSFHGRVVFHCMNILQFVYPFPCWWAFGLFPLFTIMNKALNIYIWFFVWI